MKRSIGLVSIALVSIGIFVGCKKYENGGPIRKANKRIVNTWKLKSYLRNNTDETSSLLISDYTEVYGEGGSLTRSYNDQSNDHKSDAGTWELNDDKTSVRTMGVGSIELTNETSTVSASTIYILRLDKEEFHYYFENGGDTHEFRLTAN